MGTSRLAGGRCSCNVVDLIRHINTIVAESDPALRLVIELVVADLETEGLKEVPGAAKSALYVRQLFETHHCVVVRQITLLTFAVSARE